MKRNFTFLIAVAFMLLTMMATTGTMWGQTDVIDHDATNSNLGNTGTTSWATNFSITGTSGAVYYIHSMGTKNTTNALQWNANGFMNMTTTSTGKKLKSVTITTTANKNINLYASNTAYSTSTPSGTALATIAATSSGTTYTFNGDYTYLALKGTASSTSITSISIEWETPSSVATPTFSPAAGTYPEAQNVTINCTTENTTIYYTTDGSTPDNTKTQYTGAINVTETITIKAIAYDNSNNASSVATATYTIVSPFTTMAQIFADATANTSAHQVFITFDNWVITGNNGNNPTTAFLSDGTNGCRIYNNGGVGFAKGDILSGTASCNLSLYYGMAQLNLTSAASGLTIQTGGEVTPVVTTIDALTGIKAGSVVTLQGLTYNGSILTDGENSITPYNYMYSASLENDHVYNVTGVFEYGYNSLKRINPRDENDIEEVIITTPTISASNVDIACTATGGEIAYTINNPVDGGSLSATTESDWLILNSNFDSPIAFTCSSNTATEERTATVALTYTYNAKASVTKNVTVTQAAYEAPNVTWDLSTDQTATATTTEMTWTSNYVTMAVAKGSASTNTNNYYPGTSGQNYTSTRFYKNSILTITPVAGYDLSSIEFTATTEGYATTLKNSTWTNATASVSGTIVTVTPTNGTTAISATIGGTCGFTSVKVYYTESSDPAVATTVTIDATGITNTDVYTSTEAGSLSATVHAGETLIDGASVTWESSNSDAATIDENGVVTLVAAGTTTITASYAGVANTYKPSSATYELTVINSNAPGTENNPYTVADAMAAIDAQGTINEAYVTGIVSQVDSYNSSYHSITYWISDDGETTTQLEVYSGKGLNGANFSSVADVQVGATVVVKGKLKLYNQTYEFDYNNELVSYTAPQVTVEAPTFSPAAGTYDEAQSVTLSCTTEGSTIYYTTDGTNPTNESTEYTAAINVENTTTIKAIAYVGNDYSTVATATYTIVTLNNISDITEVGTAYSAKGTVVATNNKGLIIGDGTGYVYYYNNGSVDQSIGDMIKISGNTVTYGQIIQFTSATPNTATITEATTSSYDGTPAAAVITEVPDYSEGYHLSTYLEFTGDLAKSGSNYLITVGEGENNQIQISYPTTAQSEALTALVGMTVRVKGYFSGINSSSKFTVMLESAEEMLVPSITLTPSVINEAPADGGSGEITVTCANMGENPVLSIEFCDANGDPAEYDWISAVFNDTYTKITGTFTENTTTEPRTAHLKVYGTVPNSTTIVYSDIFSITQLAPAGPSIVFETTSMDLEAGGETDRKLTFDYSGLGSTPTFTINYYEQDGETEVTAATYDWLTASIDENDKLNITVGANTGEARSAYLKVYGVKNENVHAESNLVTITQAEYVDPTQDIVDILDHAFTGVTGTSYSDWSNKTGTSGAVYAGNSAGGNSAIQFRTDNSNSGIVTTTSAGKITKVEVTWNSNTADGRTLNIYGSNTAYTAASNLYGDNAGTLIGTIVYGTSTELTISDEYAYIGLRSSNKALYLDEIKITWTTGPAVPSITVTPAEITDVSAAGDIPEHTVILANLNISSTDDFLFAYCDLEGNILGNTDPKPNWIELAEAEYTATGENVYSMVYTVAANEETTPRTGYFKIGIEQATETVYSNIVTVTQLGYVTPVATITVVPNEVLDVPAAGDVYVHTVTLENMTVESTDDFTLAFCDENGEVLDEQAPKPDWIEIGDVEFAVTSEENVYSLTYPVAENTETTPRTAYFKVAATQTSEAVYSNLVTVTQDGYVPPVVTDDYELFSGTLVEGDYIIVYDGSAMNDEVSNDRLQFKSVTSVNNVISTDDATIVWHIAQSGDYWTIYSADANAYAASTGAKNKAQMLADGTDDKALWSVESTSQSETYDFVNKQNTTNNVNAILRNNKDTNNNYGFACYASSTGGALSLYKKVDNTPSLSFNGPSANIGTYPTGEEITWGNIIVSQHNLTENISLSVKKGTVTPTSIVADAEPTEVVWSYTPTTAGYTVDTITATSGTVEATFLIQFVAKTPHNINIASVENGTIAVVGGKTTEIEGENVDFTVTPDEGYVIDAITVMAGETPVDYIQGETFYRFQMPDSDVTISATFNALPTYTIKFYVNGEPDGELIIIQGYNTALPTESTYTPTGFSISGWAEEGSTIAVADPYTPTDDVNLYALFQLNNPPTASGNYVKVTEELTDWSGEYLIVYEDGNVAFNGGLITFDAIENTVDVVISNSTIVANDDMNNAAFTIAPMTGGGYSIQGASGKYIGVDSYANGLTTNDDPVANAIGIDESGNALITINFTDGDMTLKYNNAIDQLRFRYYKSGQQDIQLYKKETTSFNYVEILNNTEPVQEWNDSIPESTCLVVPENVVLTYTGPNPSVPEALVIQDGGQLIHENSVNATVQKSVAGASSWGKGVDGWYLIASPVNGASTSAVTIGQYDLFVYNEPTAYWWVASGHGINTFSHGQGFLYANAASVDLNFAGEMVGTETSVSVDLSYTGSLSGDVIGFNLVGNPFSRNLEDGDVMWGSETNIAYLTMNQARTDFVTVNIGERPIKPGEGFFFQADGEGQQLVFNPTTSKGGNGYIKIVAGNENGSDNAYINIANGNTIRKFNIDNGTKVYVMEDNGDDYAAARVEELAGSMLVNFKAAEDGEYTITVNAKNIEAHTMILFDDFTGETIDLLETPSYTFNASVNDSETRFKLIFDFNTYTGIGENYTNGNFAYQTGDEILLSGEGTLQVFDVMGRYVASYEVNGSKRISTSLFNAGVYIFKMNGMTQKIVVR